MTVLEKLNMELAGLLGDQMGDTIDQLVRDVIVAGDTIQYASTATSRATVIAGMTLTYDEILQATRTLRGNNAKYITRVVEASTGFNTSPIGACYIGIISEDTAYDLEKSVTEWIPVEEYTNNAPRLGDFEVGKVGNVRFVLAGSNAKTFSSTVTVHATMILGRDFYGITRISGEAAEVITKPLGSSGTADPLNQRSTMGWKITFVAKRLNENFAVRIEHAVSS